MANEGITTVRLKSSTKAKLQKLKLENETYEQFLLRCIEKYKLDKIEND